MALRVQGTYKRQVQAHPAKACATVQHPRVMFAAILTLWRYRQLPSVHSDEP
jgi:hypothetical protein